MSNGAIPREAVVFLLFNCYINNPYQSYNDNDNDNEISFI